MNFVFEPSSTINEYVPELAGVDELILTSSFTELKPFGPDHE